MSVLYALDLWDSLLLIWCLLTGTPEMSHRKGFDSVEYVTSKYTGHIWWVHVIALIWIWEFTLACHQFVIGSAVATWYFSRYYFSTNGIIVM